MIFKKGSLCLNLFVLKFLTVYVKYISKIKIEEVLSYFITNKMLDYLNSAMLKHIIAYLKNEFE